jgi:hypothetical protein
MPLCDCVRSARTVLGVLSLAVAASSCTWLPTRESASLTYRLTAEIEVDGDVLTGSAVQAMDVVGTDTTFPHQTRFSGDSHGDAIEIPLKDGGVVFALMETRNLSGAYARQLLSSCGILDPFAVGIEAARVVANFSGTCEVDTAAVPLFVYLPNADDPQQIHDASTFVGIKILRVTLTKVDAPVERRLPSKYPSLSSGRDDLAVQRSGDRRSQIYSSYFSKGPKR